MPESFKNKQNKLAPVLAFLLPLVIWGVIYSLMHFYPIGDKTPYISDLTQQYRGFYNYFHEVLRGKASLTFSWDVSGGSNMVPNIAYYLGSIFNFWFIFFPKNHMYLAIITLMMLKTALASLAMYSLIYKNMPKNRYLPIVFSLSWAFCGMYTGYYFNVIWQDVYIYLPLIILCLKNSVLENKWSKGYVLWLFLMFIANFYMSYMVGLFTFCFFLMLLFSEKYEKSVRIQLTKRFFAMTLMAIGLASFLLVPTALALQNSATNSHLDLFTWQNIWLFLGKLFSSVYYKIVFLSTKVYPHLYSGLCALISLLPFFFIKEIPKRKRISGGVLLVVLTISLFFDVLGYAWQGFSKPTGFPYRFAFLFTFFVLYLAAEAITYLTKKNRLLWLYSYLFWLFILAASAFFGEKIAWPFVLWNAVCLTVLMLCFYIWRSSKQTKLVTIFLIIFTLIDLGSNFYTYLTKIGQVSSYSNYHDAYQSMDTDDLMKQAVDVTTVKGAPFTRVRSSYYGFTNDNLFYGFPSVGGFTSFQNKDYAEMMGLFGYQSSRVSVNALGGSFLSDDLFHVAYRIAPKSSTRYQLPFEQKIWQHKDLSIYQKPYRTSLGFQVSSNKLTENWQQVMPEKQLINIFGGEPTKILKIESLAPNYTEGVLTNKGQYKKVKWEKYGRLIYDLPDQKSTVRYAYFENSYDLKKVWYNFQPYASRRLNDRWELIPDDTHFLSLTWQNTQQKVSQNTVKLMTINYEEWQKVLQAKKKDFLTLKEVTANGFTGIAKSTDKQHKLLLTIPYDKGWHFQVDGKVVKAKKVLTDLTALDLPHRTGDITITGYYLPPGLYLGLAITFITLLFCFFPKRRLDRLRQKNYDRGKNSV